MSYGQRVANKTFPSSQINSQTVPTPDPYSVTDNNRLLQEILGELQALVDRGMLNATIEFQTIASGATPQVLYANSKPVRTGLIQNLSATEELTVFAASGTVGSPIQGTAGQGTVLNRAPAAGQGGGSLAVANVDLGSFTVLATTTGHGYSIFYAW